MSTVAARTFVVVIVVMFLSAAPAGAESWQPDPAPIEPHIRTTDRALASLVAQATAGSPAFRWLVERLEASDVVVYLRCDRWLERSLDGQMTFVAAAGGFRYVSVALAWGLPDERWMATLGHELRHAVEVADHPEIVDHVSLRRAYTAFGFPSQGLPTEAAFDTAAAIETGHRVHSDLQRTGGGRDLGD